MKTIQVFVTIIILLPLLVLALILAYKNSKEQLAKMGSDFADLLYMRTMFLGLCFFSLFTVVLVFIMALTGLNPTTIAEWLYNNTF